MVTQALRIVCIDDDADDVELIGLALARAGLDARLDHVCGADGLRAALQPHAPAVPLVLCDFHMPGFTAADALRIVELSAHAPAFVVVTRAIGEDDIVGLFRAGADDYVPKDKLAMLPAVISRVLQAREREKERALAAAALAEANARLRRLSARLVDAQERERSAIARDLHDSLGQVLTGIAIHAQTGLGRGAAEAQAALQQVVEMARHAVDEVKTLSFALRPAQLEMMGLSAAVKAALDRLGGSVRATLIRRGVEPTGAQPAHAVAVRVVQEALTNVLRHARAGRVTVRLNYLPDGRLCVALADDGVGFDVEAVLGKALDERKLGLRGMLERVELFGGRLRFRSRPGRGTTLRLNL